MTDRLALFPLGTVLFPGMLLPLHVFEPRYRALVRDCLDDQTLFGVALISQGEEVGGPAEPHAIGCAARIVSASPLPDGRSFLLVKGDRRYAIESLHDGKPYLVAGVAWLDEPEGDGATQLADQASAAFGDYRLAVASVGTQRHAEATATPAAGTPTELSYAIAAGMAIEAGERQDLLEAATAAERLAREVRLLERENALLREILVRQHARGEGPRPN